MKVTYELIFGIHNRVGIAFNNINIFIRHVKV